MPVLLRPDDKVEYLDSPQPQQFGRPISSLPDLEYTDTPTPTGVGRPVSELVGLEYIDEPAAPAPSTVQAQGQTQPLAFDPNMASTSGLPGTPLPATDISEPQRYTLQAEWSKLPRADGLLEEIARTPSYLLERIPHAAVAQEGAFADIGRQRGFIGATTAGVHEGASNVMALAHRSQGDAQTANQILDYTQQYEQARQAEDVGAKGFLAQTYRGSLNSLVPMVGAGLVGGAPGAILFASAQEMNSAINEGQKAGLQGDALRDYVVREGLIEAAPAAFMQAVGAPGLEGVISKLHKTGLGKSLSDTAGRGILYALKQMGIGTLQEIPEELVTEIGHNINAGLSGVDPNALTKQSLWETARDTTAQTIMTMGLAESPMIAHASAQTVNDAVQQPTVTPTLPESFYKLMDEQGNPVSTDSDAAKAFMADTGLSTETVAQVQQAIQSGRQADVNLAGIAERTHIRKSFRDQGATLEEQDNGELLVRRKDGTTLLVSNDPERARPRTPEDMLAMLNSAREQQSPEVMARVDAAIQSGQDPYQAMQANGVYPTGIYLADQKTGAGVPVDSLVYYAEGSGQFTHENLHFILDNFATEAERKNVYDKFRFTFSPEERAQLRKQYSDDQINKAEQDRTEERVVNATTRMAHGGQGFMESLQQRVREFLSPIMGESWTQTAKRMYTGGMADRTKQARPADMPGTSPGSAQNNRQEPAVSPTVGEETPIGRIISGGILPRDPADFRPEQRVAPPTPEELFGGQLPIKIQEQQNEQNVPTQTEVRQDVPTVQPVQTPTPVPVPQVPEGQADGQSGQTGLDTERVPDQGKHEPIRYLGTGSAVYLETNKHRVNEDSKGGFILNVGDKDSPIPITNVRTTDLNEAMALGEWFAQQYPQGVPEALLVDNVIETLRDQYANGKELTGYTERVPDGEQGVETPDTQEDKPDKTKIAKLNVEKSRILSEIKTYENSIKDWSSRTYKDTRLTYDIREANGELTGEKGSVKGANERRRDRTIANHQREIERLQLDVEKINQEIFDEETKGMSYLEIAMAPYPSKSDGEPSVSQKSISEPQTDDLADMTRTELVAEAKKLSVPVSKKNNAQLRDAITAKRAELEQYRIDQERKDAEKAEERERRRVEGQKLAEFRRKQKEAEAAIRAEQQQWSEQNAAQNKQEREARLAELDQQPTAAAAPRREDAPRPDGWDNYEAMTDDQVLEQARERNVPIPKRAKNGMSVKDQVAQSLRELNERDIWGSETFDERNEDLIELWNNFRMTGVLPPDGKTTSYEDWGYGDGIRGMNRDLAVHGKPPVRKSGQSWQTYLQEAISRGLLPRNAEASDLFALIKRGKDEAQGKAGFNKLEVSLDEHFRALAGGTQEVDRQNEAAAIDDDEDLSALFSTLNDERDLLLKRADGDPNRAWQMYEQDVAAAARRGEMIPAVYANAMRKALLGGQEQGDLFGEAPAEKPTVKKNLRVDRPVQQSLEGLDDGMLFSTADEVSEWAIRNGYTHAVYRGSHRKGSKVLNPGGGALWFTDDKKTAQVYEKHRVTGAHTGETRGYYIDLGKRPLRIDAKGNNWTNIEFEGRTQITDLIVAEAKKRGHTAVIFENVRDGGGPSTVYALFESEQVKLSDPTTYDDQGKEIPLKDRFDPLEEDVRYSTDMGREPIEYVKYTAPTGTAASDKKTIARITRHAGLTTDPREAGYLRPDGKMLDFSGKRDGGLPGSRSYDHRDLPEEYDMLDAKNAGLARVDFVSGLVNFTRPLTPQQKSVLVRNMEQSQPDYMQVEADDADTHSTVYYADMEGGDMRSFRRALNEAEAVMRGERKPERVHYSTAHHGTPHTFEPEPGFPHGRFRLDMIGTGEGAQAYGWGVYFADNKAVANEYQRTSRLPGYSYDGKKITGPDNTVKHEAMKLLYEAKGDKEKAKKDALRYAYDNLLIPEIDKLDAAKISVGNLYTLDIPDDAIPKMLLWDRPFREQTEYVKERIIQSVAGDYDSDLLSWTGDIPPEISRLYKLADQAHKNWEDKKRDDYERQIEEAWKKERREHPERLEINESRSGQEVYRFLAHQNGDKAASEYLNSIGIPGLRFMDQKTRAYFNWHGDFTGYPNNEGVPTYNTVIWDQGLLDRITLMERNGDKLDAIRDEQEAAKFSTVGERGMGGVPDTVLEMEKAGRHRTAIWKQTGWWKGHDGKWRFEIDDSKIELKIPSGAWFGRLDMAIDAPELFEAYPDLRHIKTSFSEEKEKGKGHYNASDHSIVASDHDAYKRRKSILIHEIQHAIQEQEDFTRGGSPSIFKRDAFEHKQWYEEKIDYINSQLKEASRNKETDRYNDLLEQRSDIVQKMKEKRLLDDTDIHENAVNKYRRTGGEVEARITQRRLDMTPEQRKAEAPWVTEEKMLRDEGLLTGDQKPEDVVLYSTAQIKSATGNRGTFDPDNPDIRYSTGMEDVDKKYLDAINNGDENKARESLKEALSLYEEHPEGRTADGVYRFRDSVPVVAYRIGKSPEKGRSFNTRENVYEKGVSVIGVGNLPATRSFAISALKDKGVNLVYLQGDALTSLGGDDEFLLKNVKEISKQEYEANLKSDRQAISEYVLSSYRWTLAGWIGSKTDKWIEANKNTFNTIRTVMRDDNGHIIPLSERFNSTFSSFDGNPRYSTASEGMEPRPIPLPELARMTVDMLGKQPRIRRKMQALGYFRHTANMGGIDLRADIFLGPDITHAFSRTKPLQEQINQYIEEKGLSPDDVVIRTQRHGDGFVTSIYQRDHDYAGFVLAHELGHADDWLPQHDLERGNILGRIAKLSQYLKHTISESENLEDILTPKDRAALRRKAEKEGTDKESIANRYKELVKQEIETRNLFSAPQIKAELTSLAHWWCAGRAGVKTSSKELYADAISVLLNNPEALQQMAPQFWDALQTFRKKHQPFNELYEQVLSDLHNNLTPEQRLDQDRAMMARDSEIRDKAIDDRKKDRPKRRFWKEIISAIADTTAYLPTKQARLAVKDISYLAAKLTQFQRDMQDLVVKPLEKAGVSLDDFGVFLMRRRAATERRDMANPGLIRGKDAQDLLDTLRDSIGQDAYTAIEKAADNLTKLRKKHIIPKLAESGLFSPELMQKIENNDEYATFKVSDFFGEDANGWKTGSVSLIRTQHGTAKDIMNPFYETLNKDMQLLWAAQINTAKQIMASQMQRYDGTNIRQAETRWNGKTHAPVPPGKPGWGLVTYADNGDVRGVYVRKEIADLFSNDPGASNIGWEAFEFGTSILKSLFTAKNPMFSLWNIQRDARSTLQNIPTASLFGEAVLAPDLALSYVKTIRDAYLHAFKKHSTPLMRELLEQGLVIADRQWTARDEKAITEYERIQAGFDLSHKRQEHFFGAVGRWIFHDFNQMVETWSKLAGAEYMKRKGLTDKYDMRDIMRGIIGSPDFLAKGRVTRYTNAIFLYSNAQIQGLDAAQRAFRMQPTKYVMRRLLYSVLPSLAVAYLAFGGDDDDDEIKDYRDAIRAIPDNEKSRMLTLPIDWDGKTVSWIPMPLDHIGEILHTIIWNAVGSKDPNAGKKIMSALVGAIPMEPGSANPILDVGWAALQYIVGQNPYDYFRGRPAVDETVFRAGGWRSREEFGKWVWNQTAGSTLGRFDYTYSTRPKTGADAPLVAPALRRFVRTSDRGATEKEYFAEQTKDKERAKILVQVKDFAAEFIRNADDPKKATADKAWLEFKKQAPKGYEKSDFKRVYDNLYEKRWPKK